MTEHPGRPTVDDVDPNVMAVDAMPDQLRTSANADETEVVQLGDGSVAPVAAVDPGHAEQVDAHDVPPVATDGNEH